MTRSGSRTAVITLVSAVAIAVAAEAGPTPTLRVVLHVIDYVSVPPDMLARAQEASARVYARADVAVEWTSGWAALAPNDGALHLDVVFLAEDMPGYRASDPTTFGRASAVARRAYIFLARVMDHSRATFSDPSRVLAVVLAHEVGHLLMPQVHHSKAGLMRADYAGALYDVPPLSRSEGAAIRSLLLSAR